MKMSPLGGLADETCDKADIRLLMSVVGGRADVACQGLSGPFLAKSRSYGIGLLCEKIAKRISAGYRLFFRDEVTAI